MSKYLERVLHYFAKMTNKMQLYRINLFCLAAVQVSSDIFAHHKEHLNCIYIFWYYTRMSCRPVSWATHSSSNSPTTPDGTTYVCNTRRCKYSWDAPDDERKYQSKHVKQPSKINFCPTQLLLVIANYIIIYNILVLIFGGWDDPRAHGTVWCPGKNSQWPGIDPGILRLVAQCLNHYATPGHHQVYYITVFFHFIRIIFRCVH